MPRAPTAITSVSYTHLGKKSSSEKWHSQAALICIKEPPMNGLLLSFAASFIYEAARKPNHDPREPLFGGLALV